MCILMCCGYSHANPGTYYCDSEFCAGPDKYCCGHNECCNNVWTMWYFWFAFIIIVLITLLLVWRYNQRATLSTSKMAGGNQNSSNSKDLYGYKLLDNFQIYEENESSSSSTYHMNDKYTSNSKKANVNSNLKQQLSSGFAATSGLSSNTSSLQNKL